MRIVVGITGASGGLYAVSLLEELATLRLETNLEVHALCSPMGEKVLRFECDCGKSDFPHVKWHESDDMFSTLASGSNAADAMVVVPCSMNTLSCLAHGLTCNLLQRVATVMLKERKTLILVPRETPLSVIHLENMLNLSRAGAILLPASPAFYHKPEQIADLSRFMTSRILDLLDIPHSLSTRWCKPQDF